MSTKNEQIEALEEDVAYWNGLFNDEEHEVMRLRGELEEVKQERDGLDSDLWDKDRSLSQLWEALMDAESLEDFKEILDDEHNLYGKPTYLY